MGSRGRISGPKGLVILFVFGTIFSGAGYFTAFHWGLPLLQQAKQSETWPSVLGKVISAEVETSVDDDGSRTYRPSVVYTYEAEGRDLQGAQIHIGGEVGTSSRSSAVKKLNRYPVGADVLVYYDPADPVESCLRPGESPGGKMAFWIGLLFLAVGLLIALVPGLKLGLIALALGAALFGR